jgi:hypothetical protein
MAMTLQPKLLLFIGADKCGSTWIARELGRQQNFEVAVAKDPYFFDKNFHRGWSWYGAQFSDHMRSPDLVYVDVSHDYLFSGYAASNIQRTAPEAQLAVVVRDPVDRFISAYLNLARHARPPRELQRTIDLHPGLFENGLYAKHLESYRFALEERRLHLTFYDEIHHDPTKFLSGVAGPYAGLIRTSDIDPLPARSASKSRSWVATSVVREIGLLVRNLGFPGMVGRVKQNPAVQSLLYKEISPRQPRSNFTDQWIEPLIDLYRDSVMRLPERIGVDLPSGWRQRFGV